MKTLKFNIIALIALAIGFASCGGAPSSSEFVGKYQLIKVEDENDESAEVTECDEMTIWHFTNEEAEPLVDGTEVKKVIATAPDECKYYGFDSKWTTKDGKLFISSVRTGGMGGGSNAGLFEIKEKTDDKLVLKIMKKTYTLEKVE
ncbi:lipocalin family protein [Halocola ammonii]